MYWPIMLATYFLFDDHHIKCRSTYELRALETVERTNLDVVSDSTPSLN